MRFIYNGVHKVYFNGVFLGEIGPEVVVSLAVSRDRRKPPGGRLLRKSRLRKKWRKYIEAIADTLPSSRDLPGAYWDFYD